MTYLPTEVIIEAKREVQSLARRGMLLSPRDAWLLCGQTEDSQTLWSIAFRLAMQHDCSAEDLNRFLEQQFPNYTNTKGRAVDWDDFQP